MATKLGVQGTKFTLNGQPTFLLGISYYGGLGAPSEFIQQDLDDMQRYGFNWLRVFANWFRLWAVDERGRTRKPFMDKLLKLIETCDQRGMVVDVTLDRSERGYQTTEQHQKVIQTLADALQPYRNVYMDLCNEHDGYDISFKEVGLLHETLKEVDPDRLATVSYWHYDTSREALRRYDEFVKPDILSPHLPRYDEAPSRAEAKTRDLLHLMEGLGRVIPVHYQEPLRRGFRPEEWEPVAEDFLTDLQGSLAGGAAGWCFHNGDQRDVTNGVRRCFGLTKRRLFDQFDSEEQKVLEQVRPLVDSLAG